MRTAVLVSGSREWNQVGVISNRLLQYPPGFDTILIHGDARGADRMSGGIGRKLGFNVQCVPYFSDLGLRGGEERNRCMFGMLLNYRRFGFDCYVETFPLKATGGTRNMIKLVRDYNLKMPLSLPLYIYGE